MNVGARPGDENRNTISETNEKKYVDAHPCQPSKKPAPVRSKRPQNLSNRCLPPDCRNVSFIEVTETGKVLDDSRSLYKVLNASSRVYTHLHCRLRYTGDRSAILLQIREIATDEDVRQSFRVQELVYRNPTAFIDVKAEHSSQRRPLNSSGPKRTSAFNPFATNHHIARLDIGDVKAGANLNT